MHSLKRQQFILAIAGTLFALGIHWWNASASGHFMHETADDASYLRPAENFAATGTWKDNSTGASSFVQRPPLFGIVHLPFYLLFGKLAAFAQSGFFFLLHGFALFRLPAIFQHFTSRKQSLLFSWIYALLPCFWGFLSYQITEALSPSLVILLIASIQGKRSSGIGSVILLFLCCWMLRPVLVLLFPVVLWLLITKRKALVPRKHLWNFVVLVCSLVAVFSWEFRKHAYLGTWGELHPIYHESNASLYRPVHASLTNVFRTWETQPEVFHAIAGSCTGGDSTYRSLDYLKAYTAERAIPLKPERLYALLRQYTAANQELIPTLSRNERLSETAAEADLRHLLDQLADSLQSAEPFRYYIQTPFRGAKEQLTKSQLNLELFQVVYRHSWWVAILRWICVLTILCSLLLSVFALFSGDTLLRWFSAGILLFLFYLFFVQRLNEDRYLIPMLPMIFITGMSVLGKMTDKRMASRHS